MTFAYQEYPKMLYSPDGKKHLLAQNEDEEAVIREQLGIEEAPAPKIELKGAPDVAPKRIGRRPKAV